MAGVAGTAALFLLTSAEQRIRGSRPIYDPGRMAGRLVGRVLEVKLRSKQRRLAGRLMRWPYGASWGATLALLPELGPWPARGLGLGVAIWLFELAALPLSGATPPLRAWKREEILLDALNSCLYGVVATATLDTLRGGRHGDDW
ncbi:MAG: hypothetical protein DLM67_07740 [Candidatus Nephthysia bennettiae]|nr:MAG: hypothetical protein DLM67_07740 [Candidatus Dormibacteraeota bacterium]